MSAVIRLPATAITQAGELIADTFFHDPIMTYMFPNEAERALYAPAQFIPLVRYGHLFGEVYTTADRTDGVAVWLPPNATTMPEEQRKTAGLDQIPTLVGAEPWARFNTIMEHLEERHQQDAPAPHWYLMLLAVAPTAQNRGIGSALLKPILARADREGTPCYLETVIPRNLPFYQRQGFHIITAGIEPQSNTHYWTLRRDPQPYTA